MVNIVYCLFGSCYFMGLVVFGVGLGELECEVLGVVGVDL